MSSGRSFPGEQFKRGEPDLRPAYGRCVLTRTPTMTKLEKKWRGRALLATIEGRRPAVSPEDLLDVLHRECNIKRCDVKIEVCPPPADFFVRFRSAEDCTHILYLSSTLICCGETVRFSRWHRGHSSHPSNLPYLTKLSFENFPREGWEREALGKFVNQLGGHLEQILPVDDGCSVRVLAWMKNPSKIPKVYGVEVPETHHVPAPPSDPYGMHTPSPPASPTKKVTGTYNVIIHIEEVVDRGPVIDDIPSHYSSDEHNTKRIHRFETWNGRVDGAGPSTSKSGGHHYGGRAGNGIAGGDNE